MSNAKYLNEIDDLAFKIIQNLEAIRDHDEEAWDEEQQRELDIAYAIWEKCRESAYLIEAQLDEDGRTTFDFITPDWIRKKLKHLDISQTDLAEGVNVTPQQISAWLNGTRNPSGAAQAAIFYFVKRQIS